MAMEHALGTFVGWLTLFRKHNAVQREMHSESINFSAIDSLDKYLLSVNHVARHCSECEEYISEQVKHPSCLYGTYIQVFLCCLAV